MSARLNCAGPDEDAEVSDAEAVKNTQPQEGSNDKWIAHLLCLSRGNFDGLGDIRLRDGMKNQWDVAHIAAIVTEYMEKHKIDAVFTFDDYGVSGHANHIATHYGVKRAVREQQEKCSAAVADGEDNADSKTEKTKVVRGWALESTNILRKYVGLLDAALSYWLACRKEDEKEEERQFVLFVAFSRYTFINTFRPLLTVGKADLPAEQKKTQ
ncbi:hypothetical protein PHYSODRAFT_325650 [Phytophthora sojae]|uniref:N-acetylglucosaminylphosphatidylinositol deacetylase n=1 Tax=Phytophthora sojae (strain P6497) TaxID=1094619 RepID=G4YXQ2_PHYSP|nr:hypothetical protein PHYSODRAFT_325650 [Phytophthora sojae]EGZ24541.1 hypothetical protein PHYSODRAFT_325650 [Phytophthora sojae]|eukprot:XP_009519829.1 hypothetical protein PHYSODRAFT_325650 [Phytophthora sojae]